MLNHLPRFITLIDELYEAGCCLAISAVDIPDRLFVGAQVGDDANSTPGGIGSSCNNGVDVAQAQGVAISELASVKELSFAFRRASSRILEMTSLTWWSEHKISVAQ